MPRPPRDYFRYFPPPPDLAAWGIGVAACGTATTPPGSPYPPHRHPADHHFDWSHGRVLEGLQIVHILSGRGWLEDRESGLQSIEAGTAFLLPPGIWHRYQPDPVTGWRESWVELSGPLLTGLRSSGVLKSEVTIRPNAAAAGLDAALEELHQLACGAEPEFNPELSALALGVVATWARANQQSAPPRSRLAEAVRQAQHYLTEHHTEAVNIESLARQLGVAYSHFRREFKQRTGLSPWSYVVSLRLARARRLLAATDTKLEEIAQRLGFSSAFHLSSSFRRAYGTSPQAWRSHIRSDASVHPPPAKAKAPRR